jgi:Ni/Co efflux regulator RcnB
MKPLPPGIAKKIARGGTLPPGIAKRYFPNDLIAQLPARPGQQWVIVGTDVLLVQAGTNLILDLLARVF